MPQQGVNQSFQEIDDNEASGYYQADGDVNFTPPPDSAPQSNHAFPPNAGEKNNYKTVKVGARTFEVLQIADSKPSPPVVQDQLQGTMPHGQETRTSYGGPVSENRSVQHLAVPKRSRRNRRRRRGSGSVYSVPASTISAFSAFSSRPANQSPPPKRSRLQMFMNSGIMFGREFCYAVEAGLTTPILLSIGLPAHLYSLVWVISPVLGFFLQPIIGSVSDRCTSRFGRRRPFIVGLTFLLLIGVTLFLNGEHIVSYFADAGNGRRGIDTGTFVVAAIAVTIAGVVIFDFSADFIEGPIRAYAMDVCNEQDVKVCLLYQAIFTGVGGAFGYASGGVSWTRDTFLGRYFPSDRQVVYTASALVFVITCILNILSIPEVPLKKEDSTKNRNPGRHVTKHKNSSSSNSQSGPRGCKGSRDANQNFLVTEVSDPRQVMTQEDTEGALLHSLMKEKRNKLFDEYETMATGDGKVSTKGKSRRRSSSRKQSVVSKRGKTRSKSRKGSSSKKSSRRQLERQVYGTFQGGNQHSEIYPVFANQVQPSAPPYNPSYQQGMMTSDPNDALAARRVFPTFHQRISVGGDSEEESESTVSDSDYSMDQMMDPHHHQQMSLYAEMDPGIVPGRNGRSKGARKKLIPPHIRIEEYATFTDEESLFDSEHLQRKMRGRKSEVAVDEGKGGEPEVGGLKSLVRAIATMPKELKSLCVCHLLGWIAFLCMALFFTDFVGQVVMQGDPRAARNSRQADLYKRGVEIGNWGLTINAGASALYCALLKPLINRFGSRAMYVFGYLAFGVGSCVVALLPDIYVVLALSSMIGVMSATLYTLPYFLVAQYHDSYKSKIGTSEERGIGTDCALVTCMIQLAQIITGLGIGALVIALDTVTVTVATASVVAFLGTIWAAFFVHY